ncbi:MAG: HAD family hydrolase [Desulfovibrionaceae bacterium]|jgi:D-glycero-D-manno-heptose 1,7-bisphosphate phosphatase|nr:HAD family hydrolase [Desulfovibrionaceae bacterium]
MARIRHVFLDRDGTIIKDKHYLADPDGVELFAGAGRALGRMAQAGLSLFLVTNQSGIGRGLYGEREYAACSARLAELLAAHGAAFADELHCPHAPGEGCSCRKPGPGMWEELARRHGLDPAECAMVGDKAADVGFGLGCGFAATILVRTGKGEATAAAMGLDFTQHPVFELGARAADWPHVLAWDLVAASQWVLRHAA